MLAGPAWLTDVVVVSGVVAVVEPSSAIVVVVSGATMVVVVVSGAMVVVVVVARSHSGGRSTVAVAEAVEPFDHSAVTVSTAHLRAR